MTVVIITPIEEERDSLALALERRGRKGRVLRIGRLDGTSYHDGALLLVLGGLGKTQFAVHTQHVLDHLDDVSTVICAGVAGAISDSVGVGDVVVATTTVEHDFNSKANFENLPTFPGHAPHLSTLGGLDFPGRSFAIYLGPVASGDEGVVDAGRARELHQATGALAVAWEGAGGARAATFSGVPYLEVRGISDNADSEASDVWTDNLPSAMSNVSVVIDELLKQVLPS